MSQTINYSKQFFIIFIVLSLLNILTGCNTYKVVLKDNISKARLNKFTKKDKYIIVQEPNSMWYLDKPIILQSYLFGNKSILPEWSKNYILPGNIKRIKIDKRDSLDINLIKQIVINTSVVKSDDGVSVIIPLDSIQQYKYAKMQNGKIALIVFGGLVFAYGLMLFTAFLAFGL